MVVLNLNINIKDEISINSIDKEKLSFLVSKVFDEYMEELNDEKLREQILKSEEIDDILTNIKM